MVIKKAIQLAMLVIVGIALLSGCATTQGQQQSPQQVYADAQRTYMSAWNTYHKMWAALPATDPRKSEWAREYHTKFVKAGELLQAWSEDPGSIQARISYDMVFDVLDQWLIDQIEKGAK